MQTKATRFLRVNTVAEMFDVSPATIYRAIRNGQLDAVRIGGSVRVPESALAGFVERAAQDAHATYVVAGESPESDDASGRTVAALGEVR